MANDPDQLRQDIEGTRTALSADVDALVEKVNPHRVVERRLDEARGTATRWKDRIMGTASDRTALVREKVGSAASGVAEGAADVRDSATSLTSSAADRVRSAPGVVRQGAEGNPLAAGLVAFGVGWLLSSLLPATRRERQVVDQAKEVVRERAEPVGEKLGQVVNQLKDDLRDPAQQAVESVRSTAESAVSRVVDDSRSAVGGVAGRAQGARDRVRESAGGGAEGAGSQRPPSR